MMKDLASLLKALLPLLLLHVSGSLGFVIRHLDPKASIAQRSKHNHNGNAFSVLASSSSSSPTESSNERNDSMKQEDHSISSINDDSRRKVVVQAAKTAAITMATMIGTGTSDPPPAKAMNGKSRTQGYKVQQTDGEWKESLSQLQYDILRGGGTEAPWSSILEGEDRKGNFACAACGTVLFSSKEKFHSGTGWPSFARYVDGGVEVEDVNFVAANLLGAELRCQDCGGHLGDVFNDGYLFVGTPAFTSGKRYCIDGAALIFEPSDEQEPKVRGDMKPQPKKQPSWLEPPQINAR